MDFVKKLNFSEKISTENFAEKLNEISSSIRNYPLLFFKRVTGKMDFKSGSRITDFIFLGKISSCPYFIKKVLTEDGYCTMFNGLTTSDIFKDDVYVQLTASFIAM